MSSIDLVEPTTILGTNLTELSFDRQLSIERRQLFALVGDSKQHEVYFPSGITS